MLLPSMSSSSVGSVTAAGLRPHNASGRWMAASASTTASHRGRGLSDKTSKSLLADYRARVEVARARDPRYKHASLRQTATNTQPGGANPVQLVHAAETCLANGRADSALEKLTAALSLGHSDSRVYFLRGEALRRMGEFDEAQEAFTHSLSLNPMEYECYHGRALIFWHKGDYGRARTELVKYVQIGDPDIEDHLLLGRCCFHLGDFEEALQCFETASDLMDESHLDESDGGLDCSAQKSELQFMMGKCFLEKGEEAQSQKCFVQLVRQDPGFVLREVKRGEAAEMEGHIHEAIEVYSTLVHVLRHVGHVAASLSGGRGGRVSATSFAPAGAASPVSLSRSSSSPQSRGNLRAVAFDLSPSLGGTISLMLHNSPVRKSHSIVVSPAKGTPPPPHKSITLSSVFALLARCHLALHEEDLLSCPLDLKSNSALQETGCSSLLDVSCASLSRVVDSTDVVVQAGQDQEEGEEAVHQEERLDEMTDPCDTAPSASSSRKSSCESAPPQSDWEREACLRYPNLFLALDFLTKRIESDTSSDVEPYLERARVAFANRLYKRAIPDFTTCVQENASDVEALLGRAACRVHLLSESKTVSARNLDIIAKDYFRVLDMDPWSEVANIGIVTLFSSPFAVPEQYGSMFTSLCRLFRLYSTDRNHKRSQGSLESLLQSPVGPNILSVVLQRALNAAAEALDTSIQEEGAADGPPFSIQVEPLSWQCALTVTSMFHDVLARESAGEGLLTAVQVFKERLAQDRDARMEAFLKVRGKGKGGAAKKR